MAHLHMITITYLPTGERFREPVIADPNSDRRRGIRSNRVLTNGGRNDCGHKAEVTSDGGGIVPDVTVPFSDTDRHYRDGRDWQVEGERSDKDYAPNACLAVCPSCNQRGRKSDATDARLTGILLAHLRATSKQAATV